MATYSNGTMTMFSGGRAYYPLIAVGSDNTLELSNCVAGTKRTISVGGNSITVTIGNDGKAAVSLMPFIRNDIKTREVQGAPFTRTWRGLLAVSISDADASTIATTINIYYIFGFCRPAINADSDIWLTYNSAVGDYNVVTVDWGDHYTSGTPNNLSQFVGIANDPSEWGTTPADNDTQTFEVAQFAGNKIFVGNKTYHFALDCRTENVITVRWIDGDGCPNCRKFTVGSEQRGAAVSDAYRIPHNDYNFINNNTYDFGRDEWATIEPQRTITIGDDAIPQNQWEWLKGLVSSQCVEIFEGGIWRRVNVTTPTMERDTRKDVFNFSITLALFADDAQQF